MSCLCTLGSKIASLDLEKLNFGCTICLFKVEPGPTRPVSGPLQSRCDLVIVQHIPAECRFLKLGDIN